MLATTENARPIFNGKDLTGWKGDEKLWRVENGEIVGKSPGIKHNSFLVSELMLGDFDLTVEVKLTPNTENSGIQFRSEPLPERRDEGLPGRHGRRLVGQALRGKRPRPAMGQAGRTTRQAGRVEHLPRSRGRQTTSKRGSTASRASISKTRKAPSEA